MPTYLNFDESQSVIISAVLDRLFPPDTDYPGAVEMGALDYLDNALSGVYADCLTWYRIGLHLLNECALTTYKYDFVDCMPAQQDTLLKQMEHGKLANFELPPQQSFFLMLLRHMREGVFSDPIYGGNKSKIAWKYLNHPGVVFDYSADEQLSDQPADKDGTIRSIEDVDFSKFLQSDTITMSNYNPQCGSQPPTDDADVLIIGMGGVGGMIMPRLTNAGLKVVTVAHVWAMIQVLLWSIAIYKCTIPPDYMCTVAQYSLFVPASIRP